MKSKHLLLTLLMALMVPWAANAQQTQTLTVYENATGTNDCVPVYGSWADAYLKCEFIIPNTELTAMTWGTISNMAFAVHNPAYGAWNGTFKVFIKEVSVTTLNDWSGITDATVVYEGHLDGTANPMTVTFSNTYTYQGGHLLIGVYQTVKGNWQSIVFNGKSGANGASGSNKSTSSLSSVSFCQRNFIPTTTFTYEPAPQTDCEKPENVVASQIAQNSAVLNWEGGSTPGNGYNVDLKGGQYADWTRIFTHVQQGVTLTQLVENTTYQVRVQTVCSLPGDQEEETSGWENTIFSTPAYFSNFKAEVIPGQGTKAKFSWTANGNPIEWQLCINGDEANLITMTGSPFIYEGFTPEATYTAKMRAFVGDITGAWSNTVTFTPTYSYFVTLNEGENTNTYVPVRGMSCDYGNRSQFIIPATDLTDMLWGTLNELTFYSSNEVTGTNTVNIPYFQNVVFKVYLAEVSKTTFETAEFFSWSSLNEVYNGSLVWSGKEWVFDLEDTYVYKGGNLLIGFHQTGWTSSYTNIYWLGVNQPNGSNTAVSQYANGNHSWTNAPQLRAFLPKVTIKYAPSEAPDCLPVSGLTLGEIAATSAKLGWTASASGETHWKLQYRVSGTSEWNTVVVAENDLVQGLYPLQGLTDNTRYNWQVAAWCGYPENEPISNYVSGNDFDTPCLPIATLPLETFEEYEGTTTYFNNLPDCWNYINTCIYSYYSGTPNIYYTSSEAYSGTNCLRFFSYSSYPSENYAILPVMENLDGMRIKFYAKYDSDNTDLIVGTMTDPKDATTFEPLDNGTISDLTTTYKPYKLNLTGASGKYIALKTAGTSSSSPTVYVDDILVEAIPDCEENTLPYTYGFEEAAGFNCWTMTNCISGTGIYSSAKRTGNNGFRFYYVEDSQQCLISPEFNCNTQMGVSFYYKNSSTSHDETFHVGYSTTTNDIDAFTWGDEIFVDKTNTSWLVYTNIFPASTKFVAIKHTSNNADYLYVDDFTFAEPISLTKEIEPYSGEKDHYYLIASPLVYDVDPATIDGMTDANYDLYYFDQAQDLEWINYNGGDYNLINGKGYLYANSTGNDLTFAGVPYVGNGEIDLTYSTSATDFPGWNLIGNPFATAATIDKPFYKMNETGDGLTAKIEDLTNTIAAMEGVFVEATAPGQTATFTAVTEPEPNTDNGAAYLNISVNKDRGECVDNAIVRFDGGQQLGKFSLRRGSTKVFITGGSKDYAVVNAGNVGEIPVSFKAEKNGSYTLSFTSQEVSFSYLHLIDNMTGNDANLLETPSYSFDARTTDYANRFRLVFATDSSVDGDSFSFINSSGNLCIFGIEGEATVQVVDVMGRVLSSETFNGSYEKKINAAPGVYMVRLINGNDVKVQKFVAR